MHACASIFVKVFFQIPDKVDLALPRALLILSPPKYKLYTEDPLEVCSVPPGLLMAEFPRMMFALLRNMKRKFVVRVAFVLFVPTSIAHDGER